jgi:hypothetical protein
MYELWKWSVLLFILLYCEMRFNFLIPSPKNEANADFSVNVLLGLFDRVTRLGDFGRLLLDAF